VTTLRYPSVRLAATVLCLAIAALIVWFAFLRSDDGPATVQPGGGPAATTEADLGALSNRLGQPIYWAGQRAGSELEATVTTNNYVYIRYLTSGAAVGDKSPEFLTVATYPAADAFGNLRAYAKHERAKLVHLSAGRIAVPVPGAPNSVYVASPDSDYQVEVYDPKVGAALGLIDSGGVVPVHGGVDPSAPLSG